MQFDNNDDFMFDDQTIDAGVYMLNTISAASLFFRNIFGSNFCGYSYMKEQHVVGEESQSEKASICLRRMPS